MTHSTQIVAYDYKAERLCANCVISALPTGPGEDFDGWAIAESEHPGGMNLPTEVNLDEVAAAFGINRGDETTFDSDYFPKVVFADAMGEPGSPFGDGERHTCDHCGSILG